MEAYGKNRDCFLRELMACLLKRTAMAYFLFFGLALVFYPARALANNISITAQDLVGKNTGTHVGDIQFTVAWDNSWCDINAACSGGVPDQYSNWDAAWVFAKFSKWNAVTSSWSDYSHCTLSATDGDHTAPAGSQIKTGTTSATGKGIFIYRSAAGSGTNTFAAAKMRWLYGTDGVSDTDSVRIKIFGIEMVYIPAGDFYIGDGSASPAANFRWADDSAGAVLITSSLGNAFNASSTNNSYDDATLKQPGAGIRIDGDGGIYSSVGVSTNAAFPTGYNAFYIMKYEVSQGQYRDFLNSLTRTQQNTRTASQVANQYAMSDDTKVRYRSGIRNPTTIPTGAITFGCNLDGIVTDNTSASDTTSNEANDGEWVAAGYLSYPDNAAFAAWAGLRPFTELEFEKAARGRQVPTADEMAWGTTSITAVAALTNPGAVNEVSNTGSANANCSASLSGPIRSGMFSTATSTRAQAGGSYYGVMELSGSLWELSVTVGNATGRAFTGTNGSGILSTNGNATNSDWPGISAGEVTGITGAGFRGGSWDYASTYARVSVRYYAALDNANRSYRHGARCSRTAP